MSVNRNQLFKKLLVAKEKITKDKSFNYMTDFKKGKIIAAIKLELIDHTLGLLINEFENNIDSMGVDLNCRSIIEAAALIKFLQDNDVEEGTATRFCFYNQHRILSFKKNMLRNNYVFDDLKINELIDVVDITEEQLEEDIEDLKLLFKEKLSIDDEEIKAILSLKDPLLFGKRHISSIIKKYLGDEYVSMRNFFSFGIHPFFFRQVDIDFRNSMKLKLITPVLELTAAVLADMELDISNASTYQKFKKGNEDAINALNRACDIINTSKKGFGYDGYYRCYVSQRKTTFKDCSLMSLYGIGLQAQCKYKILIELFAMHENMNVTLLRGDNAESYARLFKANSYFNFSKILNEHVLFSAPELKRISDNLQEDIDLFVNDALGVVKGISSDELKEGFAQNSLFFCNFDKNQTVIDTISEMVDHCIDGREMGQVLKNIYRVSASVGHPSGLVFNCESRLFVDYNALQLVYLSCLFESSIFGLASVFMPKNEEFLAQQFEKFVETNKTVVLKIAQRLIDSYPNCGFALNKYSESYDYTIACIRNGQFN